MDQSETWNSEDDKAYGTFPTLRTTVLGQYPRPNTISFVFHLAKQRYPDFTAETPCRSNFCHGLRLRGSRSCGLSACGCRSFTGLHRDSLTVSADSANTESAGSNCQPFFANPSHSGNGARRSNDGDVGQYCFPNCFET